MRQSKVDPGSLELNVKLALVELVELAGPLAIDVSGAVVSTLKVRATDAPVFPAASVCSARAVYVPSGSEGEASVAHDPPLRATLNVWTGAPTALEPLQTFTVTVAESPAALPADPLSVGVASAVRAGSAER
jgi:hypothetical protein